MSSPRLAAAPLRVLVALLFGLALLVGTAPAQAPPGYYAGADGSDAATLRASLHAIIRGHQRFPYTSTATDTWDILELAQQDPGDPTSILDLYRNASYPKQGGGTGPYNREHTWPISYGFPNDGSSNYPFTDCHALFLCDATYNNSRGNKPYRNGSQAHAERATEFNNGQGGGTGLYPGNSNWTAGQSSNGDWEVWIGRRGDVARALLYLDLRYEGGTHPATGASEPDLILTDDPALIAASNTGSNESVAYMGMLAVLLQWHAQDPPDDFERARHEVVYGFQGNRNPFIDHPEWVECVFLGQCGQGPFVIFCAGDGSATPCPCANPGDPAHGCANSYFTGGCSLVASGSPSHSAADLVFSVSGSTPSQPGLFFQGLNAVGGGQGTPFGDGLRCAGGGLLRIQVRIASASGDAHTTIPIPPLAQVQPGSTRRYQWWYRDPVAGPCGNGFNLSNGLEFVWLP